MRAHCKGANELRPYHPNGGVRPHGKLAPMPFRDDSGLRYYQFETLQDAGLTQAIFTRLGGASPAPWAALNFGRMVGDREERVAENKARALSVARRDPQSVFHVWQVHSADVLHASAPDPVTGPKGDAIITDNPRVTLVMRFADCLPIFLYDPRRRAIGIVHSGWLGTVRRVVQAGVRSLIESFGCRPGDIVAGIGPSIGPDHYPVREDVVNQVQGAFGPMADKYLLRQDGEVRLDLWSANVDMLQEAGVQSVELSGICTACRLDEWYSHRGERGRTGRFGAILALAA